MEWGPTRDLRLWSTTDSPHIPQNIHGYGSLIKCWSKTEYQNTRKKKNPVLAPPLWVGPLQQETRIKSRELKRLLDSTFKVLKAVNTKEAIFHNVTPYCLKYGSSYKITWRHNPEKASLKTLHFYLEETKYVNLNLIFKFTYSLISANIKQSCKRQGNEINTNNIYINFWKFLLFLLAW